jgi:glucuronoarabinoxylan endo-1,4-beta-xylanase
MPQNILSNELSMVAEKWPSRKESIKLLSTWLWIVILIALCSSSTAYAQLNTSNIIVDGSKQYQTIQGLGGQMESHSAYQNDTQFWDMLFKDVGVSAIRTGSSSLGDLASLNSSVMIDEVWPLYRITKGYGLTLFSAQIHAKAEWKSPMIKNGGTLLPGFYDDYANEMVEAINIYESNGGITVTLNSPIPEPSLGSNGDASSPYFHTYMSPSDYRNFLKVYGPILKAAKPYIKIYAPLDWNVDGSISYLNTIMADPDARRWIDGIATNGYGTSQGLTTPEKWKSLAALANQYNIHNIWVPEQSHCCSNDPADPAGLVMARWLHDALALGNANIWQTQLIIDKGKYNRDNIRGLVFSRYWPPSEFSANGITKDGYAFKQFAHWVRPGAIRVDAYSDNPDILVSSYWHPLDHTFTIVAINNGTSETTANFKVANIQGIHFLDIFRTSVNENTKGIGLVSAVNNSFSYKLPAQSITTFAESAGKTEATLVLPLGGAASAASQGVSSNVMAGYAKLAVDSGKTPYGTALIRYRANGIVSSELGIPATAPSYQTRVFIEYQDNVDAVPGRSDSGKTSVNTGIAVVNYSLNTANMTFSLRDGKGTIIATGHGTLPAAGYFAKFINELVKIAPDFNLPPEFPNAIHFGSLEIISDRSLSVLALRGTMSQRNEFLMTTTPIADLTQPLGYNPQYFAQFANGGGYTTSLLLLNTSNRVETGTVQIFDDSGKPLAVNQVGGMTGSSFRYSIDSGGAWQFQTDGFPTNTQSGWVILTPDAGNPAPIGSGVFRFNPGNILISESGIPSSVSVTHARAYVDLSGNHNMGLAIANISNTTATITIKAFQADGTALVGANQGFLDLAAGGHDARFADQFISNLPAGFTGVLDIFSTVPISALTLHSLVNERYDFLMTTFPVADMNQAAPSPIVFPQIVDGGGYATQFVLLGADVPSTCTLSFYGEDGTALPIGN